jgi:hypothetical protein
MYSIIDLLCKVEVDSVGCRIRPQCFTQGLEACITHVDVGNIEIDGVECRKRLDCFAEVLDASIRNAVAATKKREIE